MLAAKRNILASASSSSLVLLSTICGLCLLIASGAMLTASAISLAEQADNGSGRQLGASAGPTLALIENPELAARVLESLLRSVIYSASANELQIPTNTVAQKRGLDLGISRGFSGSQAGKHLMGLSAASFANGPGRR